jgi:hypothetical protein
MRSRGPVFGHFWSLKSVHWNLGGKSGSKGHLKGYNGRGRSKQIIDFRAQIGVYVLFAENREVMYVGQVGAGEKRKLFGRLKQHTRDHLRGRWSHFSWFGLCDVDVATHGLTQFRNDGPERPVDVLDEIEAILIHLFEPRLNLQRGKWKGTK